MLLVRISRALTTLPALVLALVLTGCGGDDTSDASDSPGDPTSSSPTDEATDEATEETIEETESGEDVEPAEGTVTTDLVSFAAPDGWESITPEEAQEMTSGEAIEENGGDFLDQTGVSADQLVQMIGQADALVLSDQGRVGGFFDNINVITQTGGPATVEVMEQQLGQIGATVQDTSTEQAAGQDVLVVSYLLPVGELQVQGRAVQLPVDGQTVTITVSALEASIADGAMDGIVSSLETIA